jgi:hypothetical protein
MSSIVLLGLRPLGDSKKNTKQPVERCTKSRAKALKPLSGMAEIYPALA